jgi:hypothetical protein
MVERAAFWFQREFDVVAIGWVRVEWFRILVHAIPTPVHTLSTVPSSISESILPSLGSRIQSPHPSSSSRAIPLPLSTLMTITPSNTK